MSQVSKDHAWNPGLETELPRRYLQLSTVFRSENVSSSIAQASELSEYCGLPTHELVAFRPDRLIVHEVLISVMAGVRVPDDQKYEDLGRNFREIVSKILSKYVSPHREEIVGAFEKVKSDASAFIEREISELFARNSAPSAAAPGKSFGLFKLWKKHPAPPRQVETTAEQELRVVARWRKGAENSTSQIESACFEALSRAASGALIRRGDLRGGRSLLTEIALTLVCNDLGSQAIGEAIAPLIEEAAKQNELRLLPSQQRPIVMNVKGASASGKSSMRPLQRGLTKKLGLEWQDFALISPDIWRKFLLDYESLGPAYKYAGMLTGHEVEIIDKKLDQRMAARATRGVMPHLLIDRFRFDSFVPELEGEGSSRLLTRFGNLVYMFFMITPPEMTVERAWLRGLQVGRYKAVEDLLAHNVEAYTGMPELFFTWALSASKRVHYEFLDNSVPQGEPPRTIAYGWNTEMTILDAGRLIDIDRFRKINIHARTPDDLYHAKNVSPEDNLEFLRRCARWIPTINFADHLTGKPYARLHRASLVWQDRQALVNALRDPDTKAAFSAMTDIANMADGDSAGISVDQNVPEEKVHTIGAWADASM